MIDLKFVTWIEDHPHPHMVIVCEWIFFRPPPPPPPHPSPSCSKIGDKGDFLFLNNPKQSCCLYHHVAYSTRYSQQFRDEKVRLLFLCCA